MSLNIKSNHSQDKSDQRSMRQAYEQIYRQKLKQIQSFYSDQNKSLKKTLEEAYKRVLSDELLLTMIGDKTTSKYIQQRVQECFQEIVFNQREIIIQNQNLQLTELKFHNEELTKRYEKVKSQLQMQSNLSYREKATYQSKNNELNEQVKRKTAQLLRSTLSTNTLQKQIQEKDMQIKQYKNQITQLKNTLQNIDSEMNEAIQMNIQKYQRQSKDITDYKQLANSLQKKLQLNQQSLLGLQRKHMKSINEYKNKIEQYKAKMTHLISQQQSNIYANNKSSITLLNHSELQKKITEIIRQNQRKLHSLKEEKQKQRNQLERKYESRQRQTQIYYEKLLEKKIAEVSGQASQFWENIKREEANLRQRLQNYNDNYISNAEHSTLLKQREELIYKMKQKMEEYEETIDQNVQKINELERTVHQCETQLSEKHSHLKKTESSVHDQSNMCKKLQQAVSELKSQLKKGQNKITSLSEEIAQLNSKLQEQKSLKAKSSQDLYSLDKQLREKQKKLKELTQELDQRQRKCKKLENQLLIVNNNYNEIQQLFKQNKRLLSQLEFKIKQSEHQNELTANEYNHKIKKLIEECQSKSEEIKNLNGQYKAIQDEYICLKSVHNQNETITKKLQLQVKYFKETQVTLKGDYSTQVSDLKTRISQKNGQIDSLKKQMQENQIKTVQKVKEQIQLRKTDQKKLKASKKALIQIQKLFRAQISSIRKDLDSIAGCMNNFRVISQNQMTLHGKTLAIQLVQLQRNISHCINQKLYHQELRFQNQKKQIAETNYKELNKSQKNSGNLMQKQKQAFYEIIQQKDKEHNKIQTQYRTLQFELQKQKQQSKALQKSIDAIQTKFIRQEEQYGKRMKQLANDYDNDKNQIIQEYEQKRDITNAQIQQLTKSLQKLRIELENVKSQYQDEKLQINSQLRSVQQQENIIKEAVYRKQEEIKRLDQQLRRVIEQRNHLDHNFREVSEHDQRKMMRIHELEFLENQLTQSLNLFKVKLQRTEEQNNLLKQSMKENQDNMNKEIKCRVKVQNQLKDIKAAIDRNDKFRDLRALQQMTVQTQQLTNKVNQMKKMSQYLDRTPLRS